MRNTIITLFILVISRSFQGCSLSDEQVLRKEFNIPQGANLIVLNSVPERSGNFVREGWKIDATFKFSPSDFNRYRDKVKENKQWKSLPLSRDFIIKMTGVRRVVES